MARPSVVPDLDALVRELIPRLPKVFTAADVVALTGLPEWTRPKVHKALDAMVEDGLLFRTTLVGATGKGRRPTAWTTEESAGPAQAVCDAVTGAVALMPRYFTVKHLTDALGLSQRFSGKVAEILAALARRNAVTRVSEVLVDKKTGRKPRWWSADPAIIADEEKFRQETKEARARLLARNAALLSRFSRSDDS